LFKIEVIHEVRKNIQIRKTITKNITRIIWSFVRRCYSGGVRQQSSSEWTRRSSVCWTIARNQEWWDWHVLITGGGFRHVQHVRPNRGCHKKGTLQTKECRTTVQHFLAWGASLCRVATFAFHLVQHDILWAGGGSLCRMAKSEIYDVTYLLISWTDNLCEDPIFLPNTA